MADEADMASENEQFNLFLTMAGRKYPTLLPSGFCYNCGAEILRGVFCDGDCREDYEKREWFRKHTRRPENDL
ncbi:TPA: hypothetical protein N3A08_004644 [Salmonella enterica subsp. salamae serovar 9,46:z4,z24:z39:z42]|nr:hypothetical protein [Salmonella enterica subsp. salamae serovar 9,46:z4,z24:z39:z42]